MTPPPRLPSSPKKEGSLRPASHPLFSNTIRSVHIRGGKPRCEDPTFLVPSETSSFPVQGNAPSKTTTMSTQGECRSAPVPHETGKPTTVATEQYSPQVSQLRAEVLSSDSPRPRLPGKTVYLLGAGFSAPLGFPIMRNFLSQGISLLKMRAWKGPKTPQADDLHTLIMAVQKLTRKYLPLFGSAGREQPSLEDLFCAVDLFSERNASDRGDLCNFVNAVCESAWENHQKRLHRVEEQGEPDALVPTVGQVYFHHGGRLGEAAKTINKAKSEVCAYRAFISQIICHPVLAPAALRKIMPDMAASAIISMNYDAVIEKMVASFSHKVQVFYGNNVVDPDCAHCLDVSRRYDITLSADIPDATKILPLIKLHGSLNWKFTKKTKQNVHIAPQLSDLEPNRSPTRCVTPGNCTDGQCQIYPTWQRNALEDSVFDTLLTEARLHLRLASRIVIIGYSLPETDRYINYLLADAVSTPELPQVEVCNPTPEPELRKRVCSIFGPRLSPDRITIRPGFIHHVCAHQEPQSLHNPHTAP